MNSKGEKIETKVNTNKICLIKPETKTYKDK